MQDLPKDFVYKQYERPSCGRRSWVIATWILTWWVPSFMLKCCGMRRKDVQQAWREKAAINIIVFFVCAITLFIIIGLPRIICPREQILSIFEVELYNKPEKPYVAANGRYYDIKDIYDSHVNGALGVEKFRMQSILGQDVSQMFFPALQWDKYCPGIPNPGSTWDNLLERSPEKFWPHYAADPKSGVATNYLTLMEKYAKGRIAWQPEYLFQLSKGDSSKKIVVMFDNVYDVATYFTASEPFFDENMAQLFTTFAGQDASKIMQSLIQQNPKYYKNVLNCMNKMFYIGTVDHRLSLRCILANYILVSLSAIMAAVIFFKFIFALIGSRHRSNPEEMTKGVIIQVPCYTEGSDELIGTFESIAKTEYDENNKLMIVICDGIVTGNGNDRSTPELVLNILYDGKVPDKAFPLSYEALGEGKKQLNRTQIYSGIYHVKGHNLPFIVIVKCGAKDEKSKAGNRGKRDSQVLLMRFLKRVYSGEPMAPAELELYYHFEKVVGRSPKEYEYLTMVDADTQLLPNSLNKLLSTMISDRDIIGVCGETIVSNPKESFTTRVQVYEYFISHHLGKSFESCFGSVTCLPGCYCMYRIRTQDIKNPKPLLVAPKILDEYSVNNIDTLHKKNLLSLGEDRYLTTLMLKHFASYKTVFVPDAYCTTNVPEHWNVFVSQRRRWINSTLHNLWELIGLSQLVGCCCFGLRFVILLELIAALVGPATIVYLYYLCTMIILQQETMPMVSFIILGAIYGLQAIIILLHQEWQHLFWMVFYVLATFPFPALSLYLPLYAFWHMDDFSWGDTRMVIEEGGKLREMNADDDHFDPSTVPRMLYNDFIIERRAMQEKEDAERAFTELQQRPFTPPQSVAWSHAPVPMVPPIAVTPPYPIYTPAPSAVYSFMTPYDDIDANSSVSNVNSRRQRKHKSKSKSRSKSKSKSKPSSDQE